MEWVQVSHYYYENNNNNSNNVSTAISTLVHSNEVKWLYKINNNMNKQKVEQVIANNRRFRKAQYKSMLEYIDFSELEKDFNLKTRVLDYTVSNKISNILFEYINSNK